MENRNISDSQLTASNSHSLHLARHARLNNPNFWAATSNDINQWLQVDFEKEITVTKVATQGSSLEKGDFWQWVSTYSLKYSHDGTSFQFYKQFGEVKVRFLSFFILYCNTVFLLTKIGAPNGSSRWKKYILGKPQPPWGFGLNFDKILNCHNYLAKYHFKLSKHRNNYFHLLLVR